MSNFNNAMEVFKLLNKSNCKECFKQTCLAFAGAVFKGEKQLDECPYISKEVLEQFKDIKQESSSIDQGASEMMDEFRKSIAQIDLAAKAEALGGTFSKGRLHIKVMGKNVSVDQSGKIFTDIHANQWVVMPLLNYIIQTPFVDDALKSITKKNNTSNVSDHLSSSTDVFYSLSADWVPFRELPSGRPWQGLFEKQCESLIKKVADTYPGFFAQILELFNGKEVQKHYKSDISLVLHPLPKIPILICYWLPEDGIESALHLFFDAGTEDCLHINSIYALGAGLARMFEKIAVNHGF